MTPLRRSRAGASTGNALVMLSILSVGVALTYPTLRDRAFQGRLDSLFLDVELVRTRALDFQTRTGLWPPGAGVGAIPGELAASLPADHTFETEWYALEWSRWETVEESIDDEAPLVVTGPRSRGGRPSEAELSSLTASIEAAQAPELIIHNIAGITVHTAETTLLAELLERYGRQRSFVHDTTWTLVMPIESSPVAYPRLP